jgi:CO dehydrogenase maturation factor
LLGSVPDHDEVIVADLEAGIGTLTRLPDESVDTTIVVVEPTPRSIDVAGRAVAIAVERRQGRIIVVANKVLDGDDRERVRAGFPHAEIVWVPEDPAVEDADRRGGSPFDAPSPAVAALTDLAARLA